MLYPENGGRNSPEILCLQTTRSHIPHGCDRYRQLHLRDVIVCVVTSRGM